MLEGLRRSPFGPPIDALLSTRAIERVERTLAGPDGA
jgi:hypothetical protein